MGSFLLAVAGCSSVFLIAFLLSFRVVFVAFFVAKLVHELLLRERGCPLATLLFDGCCERRDDLNWRYWVEQSDPLAVFCLYFVDGLDVSIDVRGDDSLTALEYAIVTRRPICARVLIWAGADAACARSYDKLRSLKTLPC